MGRSQRNHRRRRQVRSQRNQMRTGRKFLNFLKKNRRMRPHRRTRSRKKNLNYPRKNLSNQMMPCRMRLHLRSCPRMKSQRIRMMQNPKRQQRLKLRRKQRDQRSPRLFSKEWCKLTVLRVCEKRGHHCQAQRVLFGLVCDLSDPCTGSVDTSTSFLSEFNALGCEVVPTSNKHYGCLLKK